MPFVSELIGRPVANSNGEIIGILNEILANFEERVSHPQIIALEIKKGKHSWLASIQDVAVLFGPGVALNKSLEELRPREPQPQDLYLVRDILNKQIIDINGVRVVRVNDLEVKRIGDHYVIANVDTSSAGLARRLGLKRISGYLTQKIGKGSQPGMISWDDVELISSDQPIQLRVPREKITELHPADLADIISDLSRVEGRELLKSLDLETLADTLEEIEPEFQASLIEGMPAEQVADVLEEMEPDEAADLLAELPEDRSQELLELMEDEEAEDVRRLLKFPEDSAGGIMTTSFVSVPPHLTVEQVIQVLRERGQDA